MSPWILVAVGGALGSIARYGLGQAVDARWGADFPAGTLLVNVIGSFAIGVVAGYTQDPALRQLVMVGILGGFTTFSSFSLQTVQLMNEGRYPVAAGYVAASIVVCVLGTMLGLILAKVCSGRPLP
jgi:fluoride exporter